LVDLYISPSLSERRLSLEIETTLFRILQEALTNVHRHSGSATARVRLIKSKGSENNVILAIEDDGTGEARGTAVRQLHGTRGLEDVEAMGVGVAGMRERLTQLKGRLELQIGAKGTVVSAFVPWTGTAKGTSSRPRARRA
jgi:signal transduction histidine kinase